MPKHEIEIPEDVEKTLQGRTVLAVRKPIDGEWVASSSGPVQFVGTSIFDYLILSPPEMHKYCLCCGRIADDKYKLCEQCERKAETAMGLARANCWWNKLPFVRPAVSPPAVLLPKPWEKEQPPTLPDDLSANLAAATATVQYVDQWTGPAKQREGYEIHPSLRQHVLAAANKAAELAGALDTLAEAMAKDGAE